MSLLALVHDDKPEATLEHHEFRSPTVRDPTGDLALPQNGVWAPGVDR